MKNYKFLLGVTKDGCLAFGEFGFSYSHNNPPYFSASFDTVKPFDESIVDEDYVRDYLNGFDKETLYDLCEHYECSPQCLPEYYLEQNDPMDIVDCSLYPVEVDVCGTLFAFESDGCGQHDCLDEIVIFTDELAVRKLFGLWKAYHLKEMSSIKMQDEVEATINELVKAFSEIDELDWIHDYLEVHVLNLPAGSDKDAE